MSKVCALIGSRRTPQSMLIIIHDIGYRLAQSGWKMRSGGADGCDFVWAKAYQQYCLDYIKSFRSLMEVYIPWDNFNSLEANDAYGIYCIDNPESFRMAEQYHPAWSKLSKAAKALMARNCYQILGPTLDDPVKFVVCHTPDGCDGVKIPRTRESGGTAQAITIAAAYGIPVYNLGNEEHFTKLTKWLRE